MEFKELMTARYSVRKFKSEPVSDMEIQELLESLRIASTARNQQPIRAWVVKSPGRLDDVKKVTKYHYNAPLTIAVGFVAEEAYVRQSDGKNFGIVDASIAATQLWQQWIVKINIAIIAHGEIAHLQAIAMEIKHGEIANSPLCLSPV